MAELITLQDRTNDALRDKLGDLFMSMEKNLSLQTKTLQGMYKLQVTDSAYVREKDRDAAREKLSKIDENTSESSNYEAQVPQVEEKEKGGLLKQIGAAILSTITGALGGLTLTGVLSKAALALIIGSFLKGAIEEALTEAGVGEDLTTAIGDAIGWAALGSIFGKRIALALGIGSLVGSGVRAGIRWWNDEMLARGIDLQLDEDFWGMVGQGIGTLFALALPSMIWRAVSAGLSRLKIPGFNPNNGGPNGATTSTRVPNQGRGREALLRNLPDDELNRRGIVRTINQQTGRVTYNYNGSSNANGRTGLVDNRALAGMLDEFEETNRTRLGVRNARLAGIMRALQIAGLAYSAYQLYQIHEGLGDYADLTEGEKAEAYGSVLGGLFGGFGGAALAATILGALGTSVPVAGNIAGVLAGGVLGGFAGSYLGAEIGQFIHNGSAPDEWGSTIPEPSGAALAAQASLDAGTLDPEQNVFLQTVPSSMRPDGQPGRTGMAGDEMNALDAIAANRARLAGSEDAWARSNEFAGFSEADLYGGGSQYDSVGALEFNDSPQGLTAIESANLEAQVARMNADWLALASRASNVIVQGGSVTSAPNVDARSSTTVFNQVFNQSGALENSVLPFR